MDAAICCYCARAGLRSYGKRDGSVSLSLRTSPKIKMPLMPIIMNKAQTGKWPLSFNHTVRYVTLRILPMCQTVSYTMLNFVALSNIYRASALCSLQPYMLTEREAKQPRAGLIQIALCALSAHPAKISCSSPLSKEERAQEVWRLCLCVQNR